VTKLSSITSVVIQVAKVAFTSQPMFLPTNDPLTNFVELWTAANAHAAGTCYYVAYFRSLSGGQYQWFSLKVPLPLWADEVSFTVHSAWAGVF